MLVIPETGMVHNNPTHTLGLFDYCSVANVIYMYSFSRFFYPKRLSRESFTKCIGH